MRKLKPGDIVEHITGFNSFGRHIVSRVDSKGVFYFDQRFNSSLYAGQSYDLWRIIGSTNTRLERIIYGIEEQGYDQPSNRKLIRK